MFEGIFPWPNSVQRVPDEIMNDGNKWYSVAAGFFPGNKAPRLQNYFIYLSRWKSIDSLSPPSGFRMKKFKASEGLKWVEMNNWGELRLTTYLSDYKKLHFLEIQTLS